MLFISVFDGKQRFPSNSRNAFPCQIMLQFKFELFPMCRRLLWSLLNPTVRMIGKFWSLTRSTQRPLYWTRYISYIMWIFLGVRLNPNNPLLWLVFYLVFFFGLKKKNFSIQELGAGLLYRVIIKRRFVVELICWYKQNGFWNLRGNLDSFTWAQLDDYCIHSWIVNCWCCSLLHDSSSIVIRQRSTISKEKGWKCSNSNTI